MPENEVSAVPVHSPLVTAGGAIGRVFNALPGRDRVRARRYLFGGPFGAGAGRRIAYHEYLDANELRAEAEAELIPNAINIDAIKAFIEALLALFSGLKP